MPQTAADSLKAYHEKRDFKLTTEPRGKLKAGKGRRYVIQKHDATRLHYDFRLELDGVLKSWAVTRGPSLNPNDKRLAVHVEDHPLDYAEFEGTIPKGQYGGGTVMLWDIGTWTPEGDPHEGLRKGKLSFTLDGERLKGGFTLVRMRFDRNGGKSKRENWLLIKRSDEESSESTDPTAKYETSVKSDRSMAAIAKVNKIWHSNRANNGSAEGKAKPAAKTTKRNRGASKLMNDDEAEHAGVRLTHPDRVLYPDDGLTKRQLAAYLEKAAPKMLPFISRHPLSLVRCPDGIASKCFFQKHVSAGMPPTYKTVPIREKDGGKEDYLYVDSAEEIISAAQIAALELHIWGSPIDDIEHPDRMVFDLDPSPEVDFKTVRQAAKDVAAILKKAGLASFPLVTGGKGVHVIVPLSGKNDWEDVKGFASNFAKGLAVAAPDGFIATASKEKRKGLIFIDWLRNERGATAIAPYSPRARKGAAVAMPLSWAELARTKSASAFNTKNAIARLKKDHWPGWNKKQTISREAIAAAEAAAAK